MLHLRPFRPLTSLKRRLSMPQANLDIHIPAEFTERRPSYPERPPISALLIDVSGTLLIGSNPTPGAVDAFKHLTSSRFPFRLCSNTSKESTADLVKHLDALGFALSTAQSALTKGGVPIDSDAAGRMTGTNLVWTSIGAVAQALKDLGCTTPYLLLSDSAKAEVLNALYPDKDHASNTSNDTKYDSVVVGLAPTLLDYEHLNTAFRILKGERPGATDERSTTPSLIATHRAKYIQSSTGNLSLGPGPFVAALEIAAGPDIQAKVVGKPEAAFFQMVINDFGDLGRSVGAKESLSSPRIAVIGDDVEADLGGGAIELGLWRVLVKTGKYRPGAEYRAGVVPPDEVHDSFGSFIDSLLDRKNMA